MINPRFEHFLYQIQNHFQTKKHSLWQNLTENDLANVFLSEIHFPNGKLTGFWLPFAFSIISLNIENSNLAIIEPNAFETTCFRYLYALRISNCKLTEFKPGSFNGLEALQYLTLNRLPLKRFDADVIRPCSQMRNIFIFACSMHPLIIRGYVNSGASLNLFHFRAQGNNLRNTTDKLSFVGFVQVRYIQLIGNHIEFIADDTFNEHKLPNLKEIDLSKNYLTTLSINAIWLLPRTAISVIFNSNAWHCDCDLEHIRRMVIHSNARYNRQAMCATPKELQGKHLLDLDDLCLIETTVPETVEVRCTLPTESRLFNMRKSSIKAFRMNNLMTGEVEISINELPPEFMLIIFKDHMRDIPDDCYTLIIDNKIKAKLELGHAYRLCSMSKSTMMVSPLDCIAFFLHPSHSTDVATGWIYMIDRSNVILYLIIAFSGAFLLGCPFAFLVAKIVPSVLKSKQSCDDDVSQQNSEEIQQTIQRL